jgi:hypothetical protein
MNEEELQDLQDELSAARAELDRLQSTAADREARAAHLESELTALREELSAAREQAESQASELRAQNESLAQEVRGSALRYRELLLQHAPELPEELITGESVAEVDAALERARETVSKVRGHLESHAQATRVPVGAPVRSAPDYSGLSAAEKIKLGLAKSG